MASFSTSSDSRRRLGLFLLGALPCLLLALYTRHVWEDWYIMFRSAKNLATGHGLVYQPGELLQTFSSPLNALFAAALSWLTGNDNDALVIWLYRLTGASLLGATVLLLDRLARRAGFVAPARWLLLGLFVVDGKTADFSINGMETPFMVFFLALAVVALAEQRVMVLGLAWAGLMWSRPDSVVYIAATALGLLLPLLRHRGPPLRGALLMLLRAGLLATVLYAPWFAWSWWYYGSPVPQTVIAKGLNTHYSVIGLLGQLLMFPFSSLLSAQHNALGNLFLPSYFFYGGWPLALILFGRLLGWLAALAWLLPGISRPLRLTSLGTFLGAFYLQYVSPFPFPWYFPPCTLLASITLAGLLDHAWRAGSPRRQGRLRLAAGVTLMVWLCTSLAMAVQMRVQQQVIEGQRHAIGLWLKDHAATPQDSVLLECMGYIGFYSGLKIEDIPGIASTEVVDARRRYGDNWAQMVRALRPDWIVLRPGIWHGIEDEDPSFHNHYALVQTFDRSAAVAATAFLPGRDYLMYDQTFVVFHRLD